MSTVKSGGKQFAIHSYVSYLCLSKESISYMLVKHCDNKLI